MVFLRNIILVFVLLMTVRAGADPVRDTWFQTTVDYRLGLPKLLELVKTDQLAVTVSVDFAAHIHLAGKGVRQVSLALKHPNRGETFADVVARFEREGYTLENIGEMAAFIAQYPKEAVKCRMIHVFGSSSLWVAETGTYYFPRSWEGGGQRNFQAYPIFSTSLMSPKDCILVSRTQP